MRAAKSSATYRSAPAGEGMGRALLTLAAATGAALLVGGAYLYIVPTRYTAVSKLVLERAAQAAAASRPLSVEVAATGNDSFLAAQADVLRSSDVLRLADARAGIGSLPSFVGVRDPVPEIRKGLKVEAAGNGGVLTVSYAATAPGDAARVVDAIVAAYLSYQSDKRQERVAELVDAATAARRPLAEQAERAARALATAEAALQARGNADFIAERVRAQGGAYAQLQFEVADARRAYDAAIASAGPQLAKLTDEELDRAVRAEGAAAPPEPADRIGERLDAAVRQLGELKRTYAENHPSVIRLRSQIDRLRVDRVASARQQWQALVAREAEMRATIDRAQADAAAVATLTAERDRLRDELRRLTARVDEADRQLDAARSATAGTALHAEVITRADAEDPRFPPQPRIATTLTLSLLAGLTLGGLMATFVEYRRVGTLRHVAPRRAADASAEARLARDAFGLRVLATVPTLPPELAAAADDQAAKLRLEVSPPVTRAAAAALVQMGAEGFDRGVLAVTSPRAGEGRSTLALGLAVALARAGGSVLLVDADVATAAPGGQAGLLDALADGQLDGKIAGSGIDGLHTLDVGVARDDAADMLNSSALAATLSAMAKQYAHVIVKCPPLDAGDAARVLAADADASLIVTDGAAEALRRAATGRDVLQLVGSRVLGVIVNRTRAGGLAAGAEADAGQESSGT